MKWDFFLGEQERKETEAQLILARRFGFIEKEGLDALRDRLDAKNRELKERLRAGGTVYGKTRFGMHDYLQYELTRFRLDFVEGLAEKTGGYSYREITEAQKQEFYRKNQDLFTRYHGDCFSYEEVSLIIEKRLREEEYEELILCQQCSRTG